MFNRYFIGFIASIGLLVILIVLIFSGGSSPKKVPKTSKTLDSYATSGGSVVLTIDGPINAEQNHEQVRITVSGDSATFDHIKGYEGGVADTKSYPNNQDAYTNFLFALEKAGFNLGNTSSSLKDERGFCPLGDRYIFELQQDGEELQRFWATNCGGTKSYLGNVNLTLQLFQNQIPDYGNLTQNINL